MNILSTPARTAAEAAIIDTFQQRVSDLPGDPSVMLKRDAAIEQIKSGLPTRRVEAWHYTDLRRLLQAIPARDSMRAAPEPIAPLLDGSVVLPLRDGVSTADVQSIDGVTVERLREKLGDGSFARAMDPQGSDDTIGALNTAFVDDGYWLDIAPDTKLDRPIELQSLQTGGQVHVRLPVRIGARASGVIVERQTGTGDGLVTAVSNLVVGDEADLIWLIVQDQPLGATHLGQFNAWLGRNARLLVFVMNAGGKLVRQEIRVETQGEGGDFRLRGVNLLGGETHTDVTMVLDHAHPHTSSTEIVRNIVTDRARGVFQGRINVHQPAQKTDAKMACNTLLLSDDGEFSAKPELEIFADDVQCGHGATVTEIDANHLFYLMARGIDERTARGLLVKAFVAEVIEELEDEPMVEALEAMLDRWFENHG